MSAARKRRCGGRAVYCGKNERIRTGKIRAAGEAAGRAEDTSGKRAAYFYRQIRRQIYAARAYEIRTERENKEPCARQWQKDREEALRTDKNGREKSKPRVRGSVCADGRRESRKTGKNELFLWIFHTKKANKGIKKREKRAKKAQRR